jgi:AraC family transcriptional regulator
MTTYIARIQRVEDYIERHLCEPLSLDVLADVAHFSPFHFHRIFRLFTGETLNRFVTRKRLERAATQLCFSPKKSITEIALACGFSSSASFARAFRGYFEMTATQWREERLGRDVPNALHALDQRDRKIRQTVGKIWKEARVTRLYDAGADSLSYWSAAMQQNLNATITVEHFTERTVAYVRHVGPYKGDSALFGRLFGRLGQWAGPRGLFAQPDMQMLTVYHDNPEITGEEKQRISVCITVPADTQTTDEIGLMTIAGGTYAVGRFELTPPEFEAAWGMMYGAWLPQSGYQPDDRPPLELCDNDPSTHPEGKHLVRICVPVRPR